MYSPLDDQDNLNYAVDFSQTAVTNRDFRPSATSGAIDASRVIMGFTGTYTGTAVDAGAYESAMPLWTAGHQ